MVQGLSQSQRQARGQSIMKHTNTQLCVDSLLVFLSIHHNSPLIPLRSAHQGPDTAHPVALPHLVEPNSGIILAYARSRMEQGALKVLVLLEAGILGPSPDPLLHHHFSLSHSEKLLKRKDDMRMKLKLGE